MQKTIALSLIFLLAVTMIPTSSFAAFAQTQEKIPVIILYKHHDPEHQKAEIESNGGEIKTSYKIIHGFAAKLSSATIEKLKSNPDIESIDPDVQVKALDSGADTQIRADQVWAAGDVGQGAPVAILDTGIATAHPEFSGRILLCHSEITGTNTCEDGNGHGTHVAGIVGATGVNAAAKGVAPAASFYIDQVLDSTGSGTLSGIIAGIDWAVANNAKVISMSLGTSPVSTSQPNCDTSFPSLTSAVNNAVNSGVIVVAAAGNSGNQGVGAPGCISSTITVGAVDNTDTIASFSSRGGSLKDHGIVAPGVNIFSSWLSGGYATLSGTSMATPHVTGTIALMLHTNPTLTPSMVKNILFTTACTTNTTPSCSTGAVPNTVYGYGRVDALRAYNLALSPTSPDFSLSSSPSSVTIQQGLSGSSTISITSLNGFNSPVTLSLSGNPTGVTASFSANPTSTTSTLTMTVDPSTPTGTYPLTITGVSGSLIHTATLTLVVSVPLPSPDFSLSSSSSSITVQRGHSSSVTIAVTSLNGFNSPVTLSLSGNPSKVSSSFSPDPVTPSPNGSANSKLTLKVGSSATPGTYTLTMNGVGGSINHSITLTLNISSLQSRQH